MLIPITIASSSSSNPKLPPGLAKISHDEIVLIELQGSLEVECNDPSERNGRLVGKLKMDEATNKPTLLIGHHLLEGKIAPLPKPFAILLRSGAVRKPASPDIDEDDMVVDSTGIDPDVAVEDGEESSSSWTVVGVVKKKIVFSKRPMPVMGKQQLMPDKK
ncbi:Ctf8-domain-containing protein [Crassisporium funariophilum]|nr:Ctf8-domain-containing protein [Crassisporium funariophilum]